MEARVNKTTSDIGETCIAFSGIGICGFEIQKPWVPGAVICLVFGEVAESPKLALEAIPICYSLPLFTHFLLDNGLYLDQIYIAKQALSLL
jgi:hypothetical protein